MIQNIIHYSERGVVNCIVSTISQNANLAKKFVDSMVLLDDFDCPLVNSHISFSEIRYLVEPSLSDFGNPDLVIIAKEEKLNQSHIFFVEAKIGTYIDSAFPIDTTNRDLDKPKTSCINIQLSLKHRFSNALMDPNNIASFDEKSHYVYDVNNNGEPLSGRRLKKDNLVRFWKSLIVPSPKFYYVALVNEDTRGIPSNSFPLVSTSSAGQAREWGEMRSRFGIITYQKLNDLSILPTKQLSQILQWTPILDSEEEKFVMYWNDNQNAFVIEIKEHIKSYTMIGNIDSASIRKGNRTLFKVTRNPRYEQYVYFEFREQLRRQLDDIDNTMLNPIFGRRVGLVGTKKRFIRYQIPIDTNGEIIREYALHIQKLLEEHECV